jgi:hypothetical protein
MKTVLQRTLPLVAAAGVLLAAPSMVSASSHMDAPLIVLDDAANTTDVYAFVQKKNGAKTLVTALGVYPFEEPGIGPNSATSTTTCSTRFTWQPATGGRRPATISHPVPLQHDVQEHQDDPAVVSWRHRNVNDAAQNLTQFYTVTKVDHRTGHTTFRSWRRPPNNQGNATPFYNRDDNGENPARDGVALQQARSLHEAVDRVLIADTSPLRVSATTGSMGTFRRCSISSRCNPGKDAQKGFNLHMMALAIPMDELGGDRQVVGVYATTSRRRFTILSDGLPQSATFGDWVQVARQGNPLFNEGLVALEDKDLYSRTSPSSDQALFKKYALNPELAKLLNLLVLNPDIPGIETAPTSLESSFRT